MPTRRVIVSLTGLAQLFPYRVAKVSELIQLGLAGDVIQQWPRMLPGIVALTHEQPTRWQWLQAAIRYTEPYAVLTGMTALGLHGIRVGRPDSPIHVLVPHRRRLPSTEHIRIEHSASTKKTLLRKGFVVTVLPRATIDAARWLTEPGEVRALFTAALHHADVTIPALHAELTHTPRRGQSLVQHVLKELSSPGDNVLWQNEKSIAHIDQPGLMRPSHIKPG